MGIKRFRKQMLGLLGTIIVLTGCGTTDLNGSSNTTIEPSAERHDLVFEIQISDKDNIEEIEEQYKAKAVVWQVDAGFAILEGSESEHLAQQNVLAEPNIDAISSPALEENIHGSGGNTWGSGNDTWGSGNDTWGSGNDTWGSGNNTWGSSGSPFSAGVNAQYLLGNEDIWNQIELFSAHQAAVKLGQGIKIAVIDSGVDLDHTGIVSNLAPSQEWKDFVDADNVPEDEAGGVLYGHGTAVTGIILQVAPQATILPIRVLQANGSGDLSDVISAINHAVSNGADVINLSLGTYTNSQVMQTMLSYAKSQGVYVVAAVGNQGQEDVNYPAKYSYMNDYRGSVFGVGSVDINGQLSQFSNYGMGLSFSTPGEAVQTIFPEELIINATGTSFSTPIAVGEIALLLADNPSIDLNTKLNSSLIDNVLNARELLGGIVMQQPSQPTTTVEAAPTITSP